MPFRCRHQSQRTEKTAAVVCRSATWKLSDRELALGRALDIRQLGPHPAEIANATVAESVGSGGRTA